MVLSCTVSETQQVFCSETDPRRRAPPLFDPNFWGVSVGPDRRCWGQPEHNLKIISREIIFDVFHPV